MVVESNPLLDACPGFQSFFKPLLDLTVGGKEHSLQAAREQLGDGLGTTTTAYYQIKRAASIPTSFRMDLILWPTYEALKRNGLSERRFKGGVR